MRGAESSPKAGQNETGVNIAPGPTRGSFGGALDTRTPSGAEHGPEGTFIFWPADSPTLPRTAPREAKGQVEFDIGRLPTNETVSF